MIHVAGSRVVHRHAKSRVEVLFAWLFARSAPIEVVEQRFNFLPARFRWGGRLWRVRRVLRMWDVAATTLLPPRRYFCVQCDDGGDQVVFQDLRLGIWYLRA